MSDNYESITNYQSILLYVVNTCYLFSRTFLLLLGAGGGGGGRHFGLRWHEPAGALRDRGGIPEEGLPHHRRRCECQGEWDFKLSLSSAPDDIFAFFISLLLTELYPRYQSVLFSPPPARYLCASRAGWAVTPSSEAVSPVLARTCPSTESTTQRTSRMWEVTPSQHYVLPFFCHLFYL